MNATFVEAIGALAGLGIVTAGVIVWRRHRLQPVDAPLPANTAAERGCNGAGLCADRLLLCLGATQAVERLKLKFAFPPEVFDSAVRPVIEGYAQFVQCLASNVAIEGAPLLNRSLDLAARALDVRRGLILPRGVAPEIIGEQMHRWTYAVFLAGLLWEIDEALAKLSVTLEFFDGSETTWDLHAGSILRCGAWRYRVTPIALAEAARRERIAPVLIERLVPASVIQWLDAEPSVRIDLLSFLLRGQLNVGAIADVMTRALGSSRAAPVFAVRSQTEDVPCDGDLADATSAVALSVPTLMPTADAPAEHTHGSKLAGKEASAAHWDSEPIKPTRARSVAGPAHGRPPVHGCSGQASPEANLFMQWLRTGLADRSLPCNVPGALVHFVPEGMLLVTPAIFQAFVMRGGDDMLGANRRQAREAGKAVQAAVLRAGWHITQPKGVRLLTYQMLQQGQPSALVSGIVIARPKRFVEIVSPPNPSLIRVAGVGSGGGA